MAVNLFVASSISGASIESISRQVVPYFLALLLLLLVFTYFPQVIISIPRSFGLL
jgi:C4-dicarboxylate transporter DctM subunit